MKKLFIFIFIFYLFVIGLQVHAYYPDYECLDGGTYNIYTGQKCYSNNNNDNNPIISGVSGPQTLNRGQTGTWVVSARSINGGTLSYSVDWGDSLSYVAVSVYNNQYQQSQSATFTHSYSRAGYYTPRFTVSSENTIRCFITPCPSNAGSTTTSITVNVTDYNNNNYNNGNYNNGYGCFAGNLYDIYTGQRCYNILPVITDYGCLYGNIYSTTTGQYCGNVIPINNSINRILRQGFRGDDIIILQRFLGINPDGVYGENTVLSVMNWQIANGLFPDGVFGYQCRLKAGLY